MPSQTKHMTNKTTEQVRTMNLDSGMDAILAASRGGYHEMLQEAPADVTAHYRQDRQDPLSPVCKGQDRLSGACFDWLRRNWLRGSLSLPARMRAWRGVYDTFSERRPPTFKAYCWSKMLLNPWHLQKVDLLPGFTMLALLLVTAWLNEGMLANS